MAQGRLQEEQGKRRNATNASSGKEFSRAPALCRLRADAAMAPQTSNPKRGCARNAWGPGQASETQDEDALPRQEVGARHFPIFHRTLRLRLHRRGQALAPFYFPRSRPGSLAKFAAMRRASSLVISFAARPPTGLLLSKVLRLMARDAQEFHSAGMTSTHNSPVSALAFLLLERRPKTETVSAGPWRRQINRGPSKVSKAQLARIVSEVDLELIFINVTATSSVVCTVEHLVEGTF